MLATLQNLQIQAVHHQRDHQTPHLQDIVLIIENVNVAHSHQNSQPIVEERDTIHLFFNLNGWPKDTNGLTKRQYMIDWWTV